MVRIVWSEPAIADLKAIHSYIGNHSLRNADRFIERLMASLDRLKTFPLSGLVVREQLELGMRQVIFEGYRILYVERNGDCYVTAVIHGSREVLGDIDPDRWKPFDE